MSYKISVLNQVNLLPEAQRQISDFSGNSVVFPVDTPSTNPELISRTGDAEAILISPGVKLTAAYLDACPSVNYVGLCGTSTANVDLEAMASRGIAFTNVIDYGDEPTAEFIFMQLVALARGMGRYQWKDAARELMGKTITIVGLGALGKAIAHLALAYKMRVNYYSKHRKPDWEERGLRFGELSELLPESDIVVTSVPTNTTVLGQAEFALVKNGTILVQASMGDTFERKAFLAWIAQDGNFAIFDYAAGEQNYQAYKDLPRVVFPKVTAGHTQETKERLGQRVLKNLKDYFENKKN